MERANSSNVTAYDKAVEVLGKSIVLTLDDSEFDELVPELMTLVSNDTLCLDDKYQRIKAMPSSEKTMSDVMFECSYVARKQASSKATANINSAEEARLRMIQRYSEV